MINTDLHQLEEQERVLQQELPLLHQAQQRLEVVLQVSHLGLDHLQLGLVEVWTVDGGVALFGHFLDCL